MVLDVCFPPYITGTLSVPHVCNHQVRVEATDDSDLVLFPEEVFCSSVDSHAADSDMLLPRAEVASTWSQRKGKGKGQGQRKGQDQSRRGSRVAPTVRFGFSMQNPGVVFDSQRTTAEAGTRERRDGRGRESGESGSWRLDG